MSFIPKNPIIAPEIKSSPLSPIKGTRGLFPMEDGWYDIDDNGTITKLGGDSDGGNNGKSAYEIALDNGFEGTEEEWLESLKGESGKNGTNGQDGHTPVKGVDYFTEEDIKSLNDLLNFVPIKDGDASVENNLYVGERLNAGEAISIGGDEVATLPYISNYIEGVKTELKEDIAGCVKDASCELIEEITVTEEGIRSIIRSTEPDGTPYNFKEVTVYTEVKPCNVQNLVQIKVYDYVVDRMATDNIAAYQINQPTTTSGKFITAHFGVYGGSWQAIATANTIQGNPTNMQMWRYVEPYKKGQTIKTIGINGHTTDLEVGTVIQIYGVRA